MPSVMVGDAPCKVSDAEYFFACLPKNTPIEWGNYGNASSLFSAKEIPAGVGVFLYSWFYDGIVAEVMVGQKRIALHPSFYKDFWVKELTDVSGLEGEGCNGDGI